MVAATPAPAPVLAVPRALNAAVAYIDGAVAAGHGDRTAYVCEGERVTYAELATRVNRAGNVLASLGVEMEQRVALLLPNTPDFVAAFFGAIKLGAVPTPISTAVTPAEQEFLLNDGRARALVASEAVWAPL